MRSFSFTKEDRILKRKDFLNLSASGKKVFNKYFIALFYTSEDRTRLGITVTKKVGNAVKRNRLKRLIREYFRLNKHKFSYKADINIIVKRNASDLKTKDIFASLQDIFDMVSEYIDD
jgi:ribonuclease P protein component